MPKSPRSRVRSTWLRSAKAEMRTGLSLAISEADKFTLLSIKGLPPASPLPEALGVPFVFGDPCLHCFERDVAARECFGFSRW